MTVRGLQCPTQGCTRQLGGEGHVAAPGQVRSRGLLRLGVLESSATTRCCVQTRLREQGGEAKNPQGYVLGAAGADRDLLGTTPLALATQPNARLLTIELAEQDSSVT